MHQKEKINTAIDDISDIIEFNKPSAQNIVFECFDITNKIDVIKQNIYDIESTFSTKVEIEIVPMIEELSTKIDFSRAPRSRSNS